MVPSGLRISMVILATVATIVASQAVITGSFSVARQAVQLGFLPRLNVRHTSELEGQIYVPAVNRMLAIGVIVLVVAFRSSDRLANIYGVAVTATFILNTVLFLAVARSLWHTSRWKLSLLGPVFLIVELSFFGANVIKVTHGAWLPLVVGLGMSLVMTTWRQGRVIVTRNRTAEEGSLQEFLAGLREGAPPVTRVPGTAIFLSPGGDTTPLALRAEAELGGVLHEKVVIISLDTVGVPRVAPVHRFGVIVLGQGLFKVIHVTVRIGYQDTVDVPAALALARMRGLLERNLDLEHASYFLSRIHISATNDRNMRPWRKQVFLALARNAASPIELFRLPENRTVEVGSRILL
jgi:KUP system potassium uptake protein